MRLRWFGRSSSAAIEPDPLPPFGSSYLGRMASVDGNLIAVEGPWRGAQVKNIAGTSAFVYVGPGEATHFEDHHVRYATVDLEPPA